MKRVKKEIRPLKITFSGLAEPVGRSASLYTAIGGK
jgi:hypothetical protein